MQKSFQRLFVLSMAVLQAACSGGSGGVQNVNNNNVNETCVPEAALEASNIVGGTKVRSGDADSSKVMMVLIKTKDGLANCTASAISSRVLITAAHCVGEKNAVIFNTSISCESSYNQNRHFKLVKEAIIHPKYKTEETSVENSANDVALLIMDEDIPAQYPIYKIADAKKLAESGEGALPERISFYGYGVTDYKKSGSMILRKTSLPMENVLISTKENLVLIDQSNGTGICQGDSGGPGFVKIDGEDQILGINSVVAPNKGDAKDKTCRGKSLMSLGSGHISWIESTLALRSITLGKK